MAVDMFLKITGVDGESKDSAHAGEIDVLAWSWGMSQTGSMHLGGGGGTGKVNVQDISVSHYFDKASPVLMQKCSTGEHFDEAVLTIRKAGGEQLEYIVMTLKKVLVTSLATGGSEAEDLLVEHLTLNFEEYEINYTPQADDGSGSASVEWAWNIAANSRA